MTAAGYGTHPGREREAKFCVRSVAPIEKQLGAMAARLVEPRVFELNLRFDDPQRSLRARGRVLRLRRDAGAWLTYKGPSQPGSGVTDRVELETAVADIDTLKKILEQLGFIQIAVYEKYRTVYELGGCEVMLDELPYGDFIEVEGPETQSIRDVADRLGLRWEAAVQTSYLGLWESYCVGAGLRPDQLTFDALGGVPLAADELGVEYADE
jgi:adenylate cyclase class 2